LELPASSDPGRGIAKKFAVTARICFLFEERRVLISKREREWFSEFIDQVP
jgi:hypothetical protein